MFGSGFVQAQDRMWQMDYYRRLAEGTLAEVLGEPALEIDRFFRTIGLRRAAERELQILEQQENEVLEAFSMGANYFQKSYSENLPPEFKILEYHPQPWQPSDSLSIGRFMAWSQTTNWPSELVRSWTVGNYGPEIARELDERYPAGSAVIVPAGAQSQGKGPPVDSEHRMKPELVEAVDPAMSNNWAVDGQKSTTGKPLLANDPHVWLPIPSLWYETHLDSPELHLAGATVPGLPGVVIGHNAHMAWGVTNTVADGSDLYVERMMQEDPHRYESEGQWLEAERVQETITVRGRIQPLVEEVLITRHGPIISPAIQGEKRALSLRTVVLEQYNSLKALLMIWRASNCTKFREALRHWAAPSLNFVYADTQGNIGYQLGGWVPVRAGDNGLVPSPGSTSIYDWKEFIPFEELPSQQNPPTHWVATANNKIVDDNYRYFLGGEFLPYRIDRIVDLLQAKEKLSVEDFKAMQGDLYSMPAKEIAGYLRDLKPADEESRRALHILDEWDCVLSPESVAACIVQVFSGELLRQALREKVGQAWSEWFIGKPVDPVGSSTQRRISWLLDKVNNNPDWFAGRSWKEVMDECLSSTLKLLRQLLGDDMSQWQWGKLHTITFSHPLAKSKELSQTFNRGPFPIGGSEATVCAASYIPYLGYTVTDGVSYRQIVDLGNFNRSISVIPTGQSGDPRSKHYADMIDLWRKVEYHPTLWERTDIERHAESRVLLDPAGSSIG